jgi:type II secretory pathway predicted ATPase ExeA/cell division septation protein DedD
LREKPFSLSSDPRFFFKNSSHGATFDGLLSAIKRRDGILALTGEVGTGKTTLCRAVIQSLDRKTFAAFVRDPFLSREDLLKILLVDFGVLSTDDMRSGRLHNATRTELSYALEAFLTSLLPLQAFVVVILDEAQNLPVQLLEELRILADLEKGQKLLQLVLVGQPELEMRLARHEMRQLAQRLTLRCELSPLGAADVGPYVVHRLKIAGNGSTLPFSDAALELLHSVSGGIPRVVNLLCDRALARMARAGARSVEAEHIVGAASDLRLHVPANVRPVFFAPSARKPFVGGPMHESPRATTGNGSVEQVELRASKPAAPEPPRGQPEPPPALPEPLQTSTELVAQVEGDAADEMTSGTELSPPADEEVAAWDERPELDLDALDLDCGSTSPAKAERQLQTESPDQSARQVAVPIARKRRETREVDEESLAVGWTFLGNDMRVGAGRRSLAEDETDLSRGSAPARWQPKIAAKRGRGRAAAAAVVFLVAASAGYWYWMSPGGQKAAQGPVDTVRQALSDLLAPSARAKPTEAPARVTDVPTTPGPAPQTPGTATFGQTEARFVLRMATFETAGQAAAAVKELETAGFRAYSTIVTRQDGTTVSTVFLGPYAQRPQVERDLARAQQIPGYDSAQIVALGPPEFGPKEAPATTPD